VIALMLGSLVMAISIPEAFGDRALLFAGAYVAIQVGRHLFLTFAAADRGTIERERAKAILIWFIAAGVFWIAGALADGSARTLLWIAALAIDYAAPLVTYWLPGRAHLGGEAWDVQLSHFAERFQLFIIIALGESIVVTGATASAAGLTSTVVVCLVVAFVQTAALWWLYFGATAEQARITLSTCDDPGRLARDAYTYLHLPIVAGIIATAVGTDLLIAEPHHALHGVGLAMMLGGPALFLVGESLFGWRMTGTTNVTRVVLAGFLVLLVPIGGQVSALLLGVTVGALLTALVLWELRAPRRSRPWALPDWAPGPTKESPVGP
jgi:low temperature requirement protein LtrA